jgi:DNA-binding GntR family transcriptional regulator
MRARTREGSGRRIADWIYDSIRQGILAGDLPPGHRLRQTDVAQEFDVSHTPVREAIARLASEGLVTLRPHRGAEVNRLNPAEIQDIYEMRLVLEPYALEQSIRRASDADLERVAEAAAPPSKKATALEQFEHNRDFHHALYQACGNGRLVHTLDALWDSVTAVRMFETYSATAADMARSNAEHAEIAEAVTARDGRRAVRLLKTHLSAAGQYLVGRIDEGEKRT